MPLAAAGESGISRPGDMRRDAGPGQLLGDVAPAVQRGEQEGTFGLQVPSGDFTICFCALLDGLAMIHLNQKPFAMATARAQLTPAAPSNPA